jgi:hypothetical protein
VGSEREHLESNEKEGEEKEKDEKSGQCSACSERNKKKSNNKNKRPNKAKERQQQLQPQAMAQFGVTNREVSVERRSVFFSICFLLFLMVAIAGFYGASNQAHRYQQVFHPFHLNEHSSIFLSPLIIFFFPFCSLLTLRRLLNQVQARIRSTDTEKRRCALTLKEIEALPAQVQTYKSIGTPSTFFFFVS